MLNHTCALLPPLPPPPCAHTFLAPTPHPHPHTPTPTPTHQVGSVIRSPELAALVPALLAAIADPNANTRPCLDTLLGTTFINTIDAPSLALVVPVVHRGLRDRSGDTKKRAARIVGSMGRLVADSKVRGAC